MQVMTPEQVENPGMDLPCRTVLAAGQKSVDVIGPDGAPKLVP